MGVGLRLALSVIVEFNPLLVSEVRGLRTEYLCNVTRSRYCARHHIAGFR